MNNKQPKPQSRIRKEQFESPLLKELIGKRREKEELVALTGATERAVREEIARCAMHYPVVTNSSQRGYMIIDTPRLVESGTNEEINEAINQLNKSLNDDRSRISALKRRMKAKIAALKVLEKQVENKEIS